MPSPAGGLLMNLFLTTAGGVTGDRWYLLREKGWLDGYPSLGVEFFFSEVAQYLPCREAC